MQTKRLLFIIIFLLVIVCNSQVIAQSGSTDSYIKIGRDYSNLFQYDKAFESFRKACELEPNNWEANYNAGVALIKLKRVEEAERYLSKAYGVNPDEVDVQKALGSIYIGFAKAAQSNGQNAKKIEYQLKACHVYPAATKMWLALFELWWDNGDTKKIKEEGDYLYKKNTNLLEEAEDASFQQALVIVAKAYHKEGDLAKAENFLGYASKIRVQNDELYSLKRQIKNQEEEKVKSILDKAEYHKNKKQFDKAIEFLKEAKKISGSKQSMIQAQIDEIEKQIALDKYLDEINQLINKEDYKKAATVLEEALQNYPEDEYLLEKCQIVNNAIEEIEEKKDQAEKAKKRVEDLKRQKEASIQAFKFEAKKLEKEENYDGAIEQLDKALKLDSKDEELLKYKEVLKNKSKMALEKHRKFTKAQVDIREDFDSKKYENCIKKSEQLIKEYPEHKETLSVLLAESYLKLEKYEEAAKAVEPLASNTQNADLYNYSIGIDAYYKGNRENAKLYLGKVNETNESYYKSAKKALTFLKLTDIKLVVFTLLVLLLLILFLAPKVKEILTASNRSSMKNKLEKIKETGNYEANFKFIEQRYEKEDVDNMKLVTLLYAAALQKKGDYPKAYQIINEYLKKDNRSPLAKNIAGETAMALGETSPIALEQIQGLLKLNENRKDAVEYLAKAYISIKADHKVAQEYISKYISMNPNDNEAITYLADVITSRLSYTPQSIKIFDKAIKANPEKVDYYVSLMENYKSIGNMEEANKIQSIITEKFPDYSSAPAQPAYDPYIDPYGYNQNYEQQQQQQDYSQLNSFAQNFNNQTQNYEQPENNNYAQQMGGLPSLNDTNVQQDNSQTNGSNPSINYSEQNNQQDYEKRILQQQQMFFQQSMQRNTNQTNTFPDYDSIGGDELPTLDSLSMDLNSNSSDMQKFNDLIQPNKDIPTQQVQQTNNSGPIIQGPKKNCPHCGAVNSAGEYYCNSCGRPF